MENKYSIDIKGIHCTGCVNLIKMTLEEQGFKSVSVDQEKNMASFTVQNNIDVDKVTGLLNTAFTELQSYSYSNLHIIN
jgi:copper chaperone CopZ